MYDDIRVGASKKAVDVIAVPAEAKSLPRGISVSDADRRALTAGLKTPGFKADAGETIPVGDHLVLCGLGKPGDLKTQTLRTVGARLVRALDRMDVKAVNLHIADAVPKSTGIAPQKAGRCVAEGMALANWRVDFFDGKATRHDKRKSSLKINSDHNEFKAGLTNGLRIADACNETRRLAATPPNVCNPDWIAKEARKLARRCELKCEVISTQRAEQLGMGGLVNVGKGSASKPRLIVLEHKPARRTNGKTLVLVGKTITYDTGGYSLKISGSMKGMKSDKNGGMAVLGAMQAIANLKIPLHVVALLPAAENMISDDSYRPDDIITMYNGATVEVTNTDAEGRLVMADALAYACDKYKPSAIVDTATLTGGIVVALGSWCAGCFCRDDKLMKSLQSASDATDERIWRMPLWEDHRDFMRAQHADIWNSGPKRDGHPIQGAAFLSFFVDEKTPWAHLDIAGVSDVDSDQDLYVTGPTGFGVRLLTELATSMASA